MFSVSFGIRTRSSKASAWAWENRCGESAAVSAEGDRKGTDRKERKTDAHARWRAGRLAPPTLLLGLSVMRGVVGGGGVGGIGGGGGEETPKEDQQDQKSAPRCRVTYHTRIISGLILPSLSNFLDNLPVEHEQLLGASCPLC